jgi:O-acetylserine/cysteine efflux transporter
MDKRSLSLALAAPFLWGTTFALAKPAVASFSPLFLMLIAYMIVAVATSILYPQKLKTPWHKSLLISFFCVTLQGSLLFWGIRGVDSVTANLVLQIQVPAAVVLGWLLAGETLSAEKLLGTGIALAGVAMIIGLPATKPALVPVFMIMASGVIWALGQVLVQLLSNDSGPLVLRANAIYAIPQLVLASLIFEDGQWQAIASATLFEWFNLAIVCIFGFLFAYLAWFSLLKRVPMSVAAPYVLLMTPFGLLTAVLALGESMSLNAILGAIVIMVGLACVSGLVPLKQKRKPPHDSAEASS